MKAKDLAKKDIDLIDVIEFLKGLKEFKVDDKLPFGTTDYYLIDDMIEYLENLTKHNSRSKKACLKSQCRYYHIIDGICGATQDILDKYNCSPS